MKNARFQQGSGAYVCGSCGKLTRETGHGESQIELCAYCFIESGVENEHMDYGPDYEEHEKEHCPLCSPETCVQAICKDFGCTPPKGK